MGDGQDRHYRSGRDKRDLEDELNCRRQVLGGIPSLVGNDARSCRK
jgi:hypothetical protein